MNKRHAGVLLPISSTCGDYGIGDFGCNLIATIDIINECGFKSIQVLPLNPVGYGNSPYQSMCSYAIDTLYLDIEDLYKRKLIKELPNKVTPSEFSTYDISRELKNKVLEEAFANFTVNEEYTKFKEEHSWVEDYGLFVTLKNLDNKKMWYQFDPQFVNYPVDTKLIDMQTVEYHIFTQFILFSQWTKIRNYCNSLGIKVIGDIPIYVAIDSVDVWTNQKSFLLDSEGKPTHVAGVPPDYFAQDGQLWGNPLYDWEYLQSTNFKFWIDRLNHNKKMYDIIRIDHFRAFDTYWKIPYGEKTARNGEWIEAPGHQFFTEIFKTFSCEDIVVEDLGDMRPEVYQLRDDFNLMGMKIIQFSLDPNEQNNNFDDYQNLIVYTGTHDNQTLLGWYQTLEPAHASYIDNLFGENPVDKIIESTFNSVANFAILPIQDILGIDDSGRFNVPGTVCESNWTWKMKNIEVLASVVDKYKQLIINTKR